MYGLEAEEKEVPLDRMYLFCFTKKTGGENVEALFFSPSPLPDIQQWKGGKQLFRWIDRFGGKGAIFTTR